jgi:hypothetical protein
MDPHADVSLPDPFALMVFVLFQELLDLLPGQFCMGSFHFFHFIPPSAKIWMMMSFASAVAGPRPGKKMLSRSVSGAGFPRGKRGCQTKTPNGE